MPPFTREHSPSPDDVPPPTPPGDRARAAFDEPTLRRFLSYIVDPSAGATELRILNAQYDTADHAGNTIVVNPRYSSTLSAWYDNANAIVNDARKLRHVSAYICLNPTTPDLLARSYNRLTKVRNATTDDDIVCLRWFYIDVDPVRPADISATHEELAAAVAKRDAILGDHPEIRRVSLTGRSGNGAFIMARLPDYPNDHEHRSLVADALDAVIARYSDGKIKIDVKTKNPSRVGCVPGTLKCKGSHIPARPWKMATLEGVPEPAGDDGTPPTLDLRAWLGRNPAPVAVAMAPTRPVTIGGPRPTPPWATGSAPDDRAHRIRRASAYADRMPGAVSGEGGHDATFNVACAMIKGFDLSIGEASPILSAYNARCSPPWAAHEIDHKLADADARPDDRPRGYLYDADRPGWEAGGPRVPYAGPGADFIIGQVIGATGGPPGNPPGGNGHPAYTPHGPHFVPPTPLAITGPVAHDPRADGAARPPTPPLAIEPIRARAEHHIANSRIEELYRDTDFLASIAKLEKAHPGEAVAVKASLERMTGFKSRAFKVAVEGVRKGEISRRGGTVDPPATPGDGGDGPPGGRGDGPPPFRPTDMGNADLFLRAHQHEARYVKAYGDWMIYDGKRWAEDRMNVAPQWAQGVSAQVGEQITPDMDDDEVEAVRAWQVKSESKERIAAVLSVAMARVTTTPEAFDRDHMAFNCQNGTIDLGTGEFRPHDPADYMTKISPVVYDPDAKCPTWDAFVLRIMRGDAETVEYLRRIVGYAMTGDVKDHAFFICYGQGSNGKSSFFNTCSYVMGDYATDLDPEIILSQANAMHPTGLTDLEGRRLVVCDETDKRRGIAEALVKRLSGGGRIKARKIGKDYYDFESTHHLFMTTNNVPNIEGNDHGLWRRLKIIPFEATFDRDKGEAPDTDMPKKLRAEASGILNWMLAGLADWKANGLVDCPVVRQATMSLRKDSDLLGWFLEEMTVDVRDTPKAMVVFKTVYAEYKAWAADNNIKHPLGPKKFGAELNDRGFTTHKAGGLTFKKGLNLKINGRVVETVIHDLGDDAGGVPDDEAGGSGIIATLPESPPAPPGRGAATQPEGHGSRAAYRRVRGMDDWGAGREPGDDGEWLTAEE